MDILRYSLHIKTQAIASEISPSLIAAIAQKESSGNPWAARFEPAWRYFENVEAFAKRCGISSLTEYTMQRTSFGLMQIMGAVAREYSFSEPLPKLFDPATNLALGCRHLRKFLDLYEGDEVKAVASYNAGSPRLLGDGVTLVNQGYVDSVFALRSTLVVLE